MQLCLEFLQEKLLGNDLRTKNMSNSNCNLFRAVNCKKNEQCHVNKEEDDDEDATQHIVAF